MTHHLTESQVTEYLDGSLDGPELLAIDDHLSICEECSKMFREGATVGVMIDLRVPTSSHLSFEILESLANDVANLADREIASVHLMDCSSCSRSLQDLVILRRDLAASTQMPPHAAAVSASFRDRLRSLFPIRVLVPVLGLALIGTFVSIFWYSNQPGNDVAIVQPPPISDDSNQVTVPSTPLPRPTVSPEITESHPVESLIDGGRKIEVSESGSVSGLNDAQFDDKIRRAMVQKSLIVSSEGQSLARGSGILMSGRTSEVPFALVSPVGKVIESQRPEFRWRSVEDAEQYIVSVFDENFNKVADSGAIRTLSWRPDRALTRGRIYVWQVTAKVGETEVRSPIRPAPDARFKVIDVSKAKEIDAAKRTGSRLVLGVVYAEAGLLIEAEREFTALLRANPRSETVRTFLHKVKAAR